MKKEGKLYLALFMLIFGFMSFSLTLLNKQSNAFLLLSRYYVLMIFFSILCSLIGSLILLNWHVEASSPFKEAERKSPYAYYMVVGAFLIFIGLGFFVFFTVVGKSILYFSVIVAAGGILLLVRGLMYYIEEMIRKRTFLRS